MTWKPVADTYYANVQRRLSCQSAAILRSLPSFTTASHVFGQNGKKEHGFDNVKVTNSAWDTNVISASTVRIHYFTHILLYRSYSHSALSLDVSIYSATSL